MKRTTLTLLAAASAIALAGCVPSTYGYGNYGGYGNSSYGNRYGGSSPYGSPYPYGNSYPYGSTAPYGSPYPYGNARSPYGSGSYSSRPTYGSDGTFRCESNDMRVARCLVDTRGGVSLVRQDSDAPCIQGRTWGYDRDGVWVSNGCRARFAVGSYGYSNGYGSPYSGRDAQTIRCESQDGRRDVCGLPFRARSVALSRQLSDTTCRQGTNWGWSGDTVWVDNGCRAEFVARY